MKRPMIDPLYGAVSVLIAEDDKLARMDLRALVERLPGVGKIHEAATVEAALELMPKCSVLFLDIAMGAGSGFDIAAKTDPAKHSVIFTTAHKEHAVRAFEINATDYLLKPVESARLLDAWSRAGDRLHKDALSNSRHRFTLRGPTGIEFHPVVTLVSVHAEGNYLRLHLFGRKPVILRETFENWIHAFPTGHLIEAGRGRAVNRHHILAIEGPHDERRVVLSDGRMITVSRRRAAEFEREAMINTPKTDFAAG